MAQDDTSAIDADAQDDDDEILPWVKVQPNARIEIAPTDVVYAGELSTSARQNDSSFAVIDGDVDVINGTLFVNDEKPSDGTTADAADEDEPRATDYRIISEDSPVGTFVKGSLTTDENGANVYDEADGIAEDRVVIFFNGMTGQRLGRTLDFNGNPYARWTDTPYLVKGLYQCHPEWRGANGAKRSELASNGNAPRVARPLIPRFKVDGNDLLDESDGSRYVIDMSLLDGRDPTNGYELHVFDAEAMREEFGDVTTPIDEMDTGQYGLDVDSELAYPRHENPEAILEQAGVGYFMFTNDDWQSEPADWSLEYDTGTDFGIASELVTEEQSDEAAFEQELHDFADEVIAALPDGAAPEDAFDGGLDGLVDAKASMFSDEPSESDIQMIRQEVYSGVNWLDSSSLEE